MPEIITFFIGKLCKSLLELILLTTIPNVLTVSKVVNIGQKVGLFYISQSLEDIFI